MRRRTTVTTLEQLEDVIRAIKEHGIFCFDTETRGFVDKHPDVLDLIEEEWQEKERNLRSNSPSVRQRSRQAIVDRWASSLALDTLRNEVFWLGIAVPGRSWAIPMGHPNGEVLVPEERGDGSTVPPPGHRAILASGKESMAKAKYLIPATFTPAPDQLTPAQVFGALEDVFLHDGIDKVGHNLKFDCKSISKYYAGALPDGMWYDTMVLQHVLDENLMKYSLKHLTDVNYRHDPYHKFGKIGDRITTEPYSKAAHYVHLDVRWSWLLYRRLWRRLEADALLHATARRDSLTLAVLAQMELNGIHVEVKKLKQLGQELELELNNTYLEMMPHVPVGFNPDANKDKQKLLFDKKREGGLGLRPVKMTAKGAPSVDRSVLDKLARGVDPHPVVPLLIQWQNLTKLKSTYVDGMRSQLHKGKLHPQFHLHRTDTGRLSSSDPNLQNIPRDGKVRSLFVAGPGERLVVCDYDQIELRVMAMFSQDPNLSRIFIEGTKDIHTATACLVLGREYGDVTPDERVTFGKMPNFLMGYGGSPNLLAEKIGIPIEQAEEVHAGYMKAYKRMFEWKREVIEQAHARGYVETAGGRRRRLEKDLRSNDRYDVYRAERQAVNAVVQGTASEICKDAMVRVAAALPHPECKMLVQVHDELVVSVPRESALEWKSVIETAMGDGQEMMGIPLRAQGDTAHSWYDAK